MLLYFYREKKNNPQSCFYAKPQQQIKFVTSNLLKINADALSYEITSADTVKTILPNLKTKKKAHKNHLEQSARGTQWKPSTNLSSQFAPKTYYYFSSPTMENSQLQQII